MEKKKFKFDGFKDLVVRAKKGDHAVSFDLIPPGIIMWSCTLPPEPPLGLSGRTVITSITAFPSGSLQPLGYSQK
jgi:hypothetical protein